MSELKPNSIPLFTKKRYAAFLPAAAITTAVALEMQPASAVGTVPPEVQKNIDDTTATIGALVVIGTAAVAAALVPFGSSLALGFVHKIMARM